jgi:hypothetical protein
MSSRPASIIAFEELLGRVDPELADWSRRTLTDVEARGLLLSRDRLIVPPVLEEQVRIVGSRPSCIAWPDDCDHEGCPVVFAGPQDAARYPSGMHPTTYPAICPCECVDCKREWWKAGRPLVRGGKIVRAGK